jgi:CO dehydrogenase maturation factor
MDMEAGIEHLGRATTRGVDRLIVVVEPGRRSVETALHVRQLAKDLGLTKVSVVGNKIRGPGDEEFLRKNITDLPILGFLPFDSQVIEADLQGRPAHELSPVMLAAAQEIGKQLIKD